MLTKQLKRVLLAATCLWLTTSGLRTFAQTVETEEVIGELSPTTNLSSYTYRYQHDPFRTYEGWCANGRLSQMTPDGRHFVWLEKFTKSKWTLSSGGRVFIDGKFLGESYETDVKRVIGPGGHHIAFRARQGKKEVCIVDGVVQGGEYDEVASPITSDGTHWAFAIKRDKKWSVLLNGALQGLAFDKIGSIVFSDNGEHLAFTAKQGKTWCVVLDGKTSGQPTEDEPAFLVFHGETLLEGYCSKNPSKCIIVADGKESLSFDGTALGYPIATPQGGIIYEVSPKYGEHHYVIDGKEGPDVKVLGDIVFSPDGSRYAYAAAVQEGSAKKKTLGFMVIDGQKSPTYQGVTTSGWLDFLPGGHFVYLRTGRREKMSSWAHGVSDPVFSSDSHHVCYVARDATDVFVVCDGQRGPTFKHVYELGFSNEMTPQYGGWKGQKLLSMKGESVTSEVVIPANVNNIEGAELDRQWKLKAFVVVTGGGLYLSGDTLQAKRRAIVNGKVEQQYNCYAISDALFTPNDQHYAYEVHEADEKKSKSFIVLDGKEGKLYDEIIPGNLKFEEDGRLTYLARAGYRFLRVSLKLPERPSSQGSVAK